MFKLTKALKIEAEILLAILFVAVFNVILYVNLSFNLNKHADLLAKSIEFSLIIYGGYVILSILCVVLNKKRWLKAVFIGLLIFMTVHIVSNLYALIINPHISDNGQAILTDALFIWTVSILVFSLWYWIIDRGGPISRQNESEETRYDLLFPQYQSKIPGWHEWHPRFLDYLFFSFFTSSGFTPSDTLPLTKRVKLLMMVEAFISLIIIGMVVSRAISIIQ